MDDGGNHALHALLERLMELTTRRLDAIEERLRGLDQDTGEIIGLLIALKAAVETSGVGFVDDGSDDEPEEEGLCAPTLN